MKEKFNLKIFLKLFKEPEPHPCEGNKKSEPEPEPCQNGTVPQHWVRYAAISRNSLIFRYTSVADPDHYHTHPDPNFYSDPLRTGVKILLNKVQRPGQILPVHR